MERASQRPGVARAGRRRRRFAWLAVLPVLAALVGAGWVALAGGALRESVCWVLPNARVLIPPGDARCPLRPHEQIRRVRVLGAGSVLVSDAAAFRKAVSEAGSSLRVGVLREGREQWVEIAVREVPRHARLVRLAAAALVAAALLSVPIFLLWRAPSRAGVPLALFYSAVAVVGVTLIGGRSSPWLTRAALIAMVAAPAVLAHLSLIFPRERRVIREAPELLAVPYALCALLAAMG